MSIKKAMRVISTVLVIGLFAAPALAEHFDWTDTTSEPTAEDAHVTCPEVEEGEDAEAAQEECDQAVADSFSELNEYDHPENHGKYVSFVAHCLKGAAKKGQLLKEVAQADEDSQIEAAVATCSDFALNGETNEDAKEARAEAREARKAGTSDDDSEEDSDLSEAGDAEDGEASSGKGKGNANGKGKSKD
jgi:hypothetical protein